MKKTNYYSPSEIIERATEHMVVLETQKTFTIQMATVLSMHLAKVQAIEVGICSSNQLPNTSCFVISPTGTGKSYILKALAKASGMNVSFIDSTQLTQSGYKGLNLMTAIAQIVKDNPCFFDSANMLVFDEFDKTFNGQVNSEGFCFSVQRDLLKLFEGSDYNISASAEYAGKSTTVNLDKTFIVLAGACSGINNILMKRYAPKVTIGFSASETKNTTNVELIKQADINDLVNYGMLREIAGRVNSVFHIGSLSKEDYKAIISSDSKVSSLSQYRNLFKSRGCKLSINDAAVNKIADIAVTRNMGARTVNAVLLEQLYPAYNYLENHLDYNKVTLRVNSNDEFVLSYKKGGRQEFTTPIEENSHMLYNLIEELFDEQNIDIFCNTICSLANLIEHEDDMFLYSFLQLVCRYYKARVRPSERNIENVLKLAKATKRPVTGGISPFEIICIDYLKASDKVDKDNTTTTSTPKFVETFRTHFETYKEYYFPETQALLYESIANAAKLYVNNQTSKESSKFVDNT